MTNENQEPSSGEEASPPPWLDVAFVEKVLRINGEHMCQVARVAVRPATGAGENYCSALFRAEATLAGGGGERRRLIVKAPPAGAETAAYVRSFQMFSREGEMLAQVIPEMQELLEAASGEKLPPLAPRCLLRQEGPEECLVMEDLAPAGFRMADRKRGLGLRHSLLALRSLARFHAASHAVLRRRPALLRTFDNSWRVANDGLQRYVRAGLQSAADVCRAASGLQQFAEALEKVKETVVAKWIELNDPPGGDFDVIGHGDYWTNNMMFRYEDGQPCEYRLIDHQLCHVSSPALDVIHLLHTSLSENVSMHYEDLLLREYHVALEEYATLLGVKAPTRAQFLADVEARGAFALFGALCETPLMRAHAAADLDGSLGGDPAATAHAYHTPEMRAWFTRVLPKFQSKGWLAP